MSKNIPSQLEELLALQSPSNRRAMLTALLPTLPPSELFVLRNALSSPAMAIDLVSALPLELSLRVLSRLDVQTVGRAEKTCSRWLNLIKSTNTWRTRYLGLIRPSDVDLHVPPSLAPKMSTAFNVEAACSSGVIPPYKLLCRHRHLADRGWRSGEPKLLGRLRGHRDKVTAALFLGVVGVVSPIDAKAATEIVKWDSRVGEAPLLITASADKSIRLWHLSPPSPLVVLPSTHSLSCIAADVKTTVCEEERDPKRSSKTSTQIVRIVAGSFTGLVTLFVLSVETGPDASVTVTASATRPPKTTITTRLRLLSVRSLGQISGSPILGVKLWGSWVFAVSASGVKGICVGLPESVKVDEVIVGPAFDLIKPPADKQYIYHSILPITLPPDHSHHDLSSPRSYLVVLAGEVTDNEPGEEQGTDRLIIIDISSFTAAEPPDDFRTSNPTKPQVVARVVMVGGSMGNTAAGPDTIRGMYARRQRRRTGQTDDVVITVVWSKGRTVSVVMSDVLEVSTASGSNARPPCWSRTFTLQISSLRNPGAPAWEDVVSCAHDSGHTVWIQKTLWGWCDELDVDVKEEGSGSPSKASKARFSRTFDAPECIAVDGDLVAVGTGHKVVDVMLFGAVGSSGSASEGEGTKRRRFTTGE
ncbi:hypothetical protein HDU93_008590 [Gonapodya sp. JEL0774]|nr:hypothetical protein HDU93_008590 [Gonapodya sp. JEL0774]